MKNFEKLNLKTFANNLFHIWQTKNICESHIGKLNILVSKKHDDVEILNYFKNVINENMQPTPNPQALAKVNSDLQSAIKNFVDTVGSTNPELVKQMQSLSHLAQTSMQKKVAMPAAPHGQNKIQPAANIMQ